MAAMELLSREQIILAFDRLNAALAAKGVALHRRQRLPQQGFAQQFICRGVGFKDVAARIEHQYTAGQSLDQRRHASGEMVVAGMRLDQIALQLRHLVAQRIKRARQLLRYGTEGVERRLQIGALIARNVVLCR